MPKYFIGIDLGGTKIFTVLADSKGKILAESLSPTDANRGPKAVISRLIDQINAMQARFPEKKISALGICAPGPVDYKNGIVSNPPNLPGWKRVPLAKILEKKFKVPVKIDNDANCAALAEARFGAGKGKQNFVYLTISTGIGGGIIIHGDLYRGAVGAAGEIGHTVIQKGGPLCGCGVHGHFESLASGTGVQKLFGYSSIELFEGVKTGKSWAKKDLLILADNLGIGIANTINIFNPELIVIGGGLSHMGEFLLKPVRAAVKKYALPLPFSCVKIVRAQLGAKAEALGAIALCL